jgi:hypothetical protein
VARLVSSCRVQVHRVTLPPPIPGARRITSGLSDGRSPEKIGTPLALVVPDPITRGARPSSPSKRARITIFAVQVLCVAREGFTLSIDSSLAPAVKATLPVRLPNRREASSSVVESAPRLVVGLLQRSAPSSASNARQIR